MPRNVLAITYWGFNEALIQTYTLPYLKLIQEALPSNSKIFLFTLEKKGSRVDRNEKIKLRKQGIYLVNTNYHRFGFRAGLSMITTFVRLIFLILRRNVSTLHCWCTPGGAIGYILSIITNRELILDSYEPHAESMVESNVWDANSWAFKILFKLEKLQTRRASTIVSATDGMRSYMNQTYGESKENFYVKPACTDFNIFNSEKSKNEDLKNKLGLSKKLICVYAGKFGGIYLDQEIFDLMKIAYDFWGDKFHFLLLTNEPEDKVLSYAKKSSFPVSQLTIKFVEHQYVADYIGLADFALTPVKPIPTKRYCTPIKNGEYWAMGLPVIITENISDDSDIIIRNQIGATIVPDNTSSYKKAITTIDQLINKEEKLTFKVEKIAEKYRSFEIASNIYRKIYGRK